MAVLFYISWSRRLLEKVICTEHTEGRKGELKYLGGRKQMSSLREEQARSGTEASEWVREGPRTGAEL